MALAYLLELNLAGIILAGIASGLLFGALFGLSMAPSLQPTTVRVAFEDQNEFLSIVHAALDNLSYLPKSQSESLHTYKPSWRAGVLAGEISVAMQDGRGALMGPSMYIRRLAREIDRSHSRRGGSTASG